MDIITRAEAKERGLKHYFTGRLCKNGHVDQRYTGDGSCASCNKFKLKIRNLVHANKYALEQRERYAADPTKARASSKKWKDKSKKHQSERRRERTLKQRLDVSLTTYLSSLNQDKPW